MQSPVDLTLLREMTDGDMELEQSLFSEFITAFEDGIKIMMKSFDPAGIEQWRGQAHGLKGMALNLGAAHLADLCKKAQEDCETDALAKGKMLEEIAREYERVRQFLRHDAAA